MEPEMAAKWYWNFYQSLVQQGFDPEFAETLVLRAVPKNLAEKKENPRELLKRGYESSRVRKSGV